MVGDIGTTIQELRQLQHDVAGTFNLVDLFLELIRARDERGVTNDQLMIMVRGLGFGA
jgi:hypothetical protein